MLLALFHKSLDLGDCWQMLSEQRLIQRGGQMEQHTLIHMLQPMEILGTINKGILTESLFVEYYLDIGVNNKGYWNSYHMSLPIWWRCWLLASSVHPPLILCSYLITVKGMLSVHIKCQSKFYGGAQPRMRDTTNLAEDEGWRQGISWSARTCAWCCWHSVYGIQVDDAGLWWYLTHEQQAIQRHNWPTGKSKHVEKSKKLCLEALHAR
jgi:hypothetical protein